MGRAGGRAQGAADRVSGGVAGGDAVLLERQDAGAILVQATQRPGQISGFGEGTGATEDVDPAEWVALPRRGSPSA